MGFPKMHIVEFTESAIEDLRCLRKHEQGIIVDSIEQQLVHEPITETRNRKPLRPNNLSQWELRVDRFRVFYDVSGQDATVIVKAVGWKEHNKLYIRDKEFLL
jgi:mRNA-degrading endonuclease RelE of RelBE toxin-antitoxin system